MPQGGADGPLALFIHGGYWRSLEPSSFSQMARGMNAHGVTVAVSGYDLCPQVSIAEIIRADAARPACICGGASASASWSSGHSAGGHLAACMVATDWKALDAERAGRSGAGRLCDLRPVRSRAADCISRPTPTSSSTRPSARASRRCSGRRQRGRVLDAVVGGDGIVGVPAAEPRSSPTAGAASGVETRYEAMPGLNHFTVCDPMLDAGQRDDEAAGRAGEANSRTSTATANTAVSNAPTATTTARASAHAAGGAPDARR